MTNSQIQLANLAKDVKKKKKEKDATHNARSQNIDPAPPHICGLSPV
jgi:hypothetical protein